MAPRLAACEPCRRNKLACSHERPTCTRCQHSSKVGSCTYRESPFKRKPTIRSRPSRSPRSHPPARRSRPTEPPHVRVSVRGTQYPNPGYRGPLSHNSIFNEITAEKHPGLDVVAPNLLNQDPLEEQPSVGQGARLSQTLLSSYDLDSLRNLVKLWRAKGINLAVAEPLVDICIDTSNYSLLSRSRGGRWALDFATNLQQNTALPLDFDYGSTISTYSRQFLGLNTRWETFGIFLLAAIQATRDIPVFPPLYTTPSEKRELRRLLSKLADCALDICLSTDNMNDLQLAFQYENVIVHSYVDGDESYHYWRSLGDVISSIFALGYHENAESKPGVPRFLIELRKTIFARTYSADKNVAIFLGRPLRMSKRFCSFQVPWCPLEETVDEAGVSPASDQGDVNAWHADTCFSYSAETRWSAICASIKEDIMELPPYSDRVVCLEKTSALQAAAESAWNALPSHFRYEGDLKQSSHSAFERDFLISTRLNYLHISFLLQRYLLSQIAEPSAAMIQVAQTMLHLVVDAVLLREELINSGTGLDWKIVYYGLPGAGILLLAILRQKRDPSSPRVLKAQVLQDLAILTAEVERGTVLRSEEPNYALLVRATQTIQQLLDNFLSDDTIEPPSGEHHRHWYEQLEFDSRGFDHEFWENLMDHSTWPSMDGLVSN